MAENIMPDNFNLFPKCRAVKEALGKFVSRTFLSPYPIEAPAHMSNHYTHDPLASPIEPVIGFPPAEPWPLESDGLHLDGTWEQYQAKGRVVMNHEVEAL